MPLSSPPAFPPPHTPPTPPTHPPHPPTHPGGGLEDEDGSAAAATAAAAEEGRPTVTSSGARRLGLPRPLDLPQLGGRGGGPPPSGSDLRGGSLLRPPEGVSHHEYGIAAANYAARLGHEAACQAAENLPSWDKLQLFSQRSAEGLAGAVVARGLQLQLGQQREGARGGALPPGPGPGHGPGHGPAGHGPDLAAAPAGARAPAAAGNAAAAARAAHDARVAEVVADGLAEQANRAAPVKKP
jgi:hypothetical protein